MSQNESWISSQIADLFPAQYREDGETLVQFFKSYYEWMELVKVEVAENTGGFEKNEVLTANTSGASLRFVSFANTNSSNTTGTVYASLISSQISLKEGELLTGASNQGTAITGKISFNPLAGSTNFTNITDVDDTFDRFIQYFKKEVMAQFPTSIQSDKRLLTKRIKDLYYAKGTQEAHKLLFRILYNEEIQVYYPGDFILRASDGRWVQDTSVRVGDPSTGDIQSLVGRIITGVDSGATARVDRITNTYQSGIFVRELFISNETGTFSDNETIRNSDSSVIATIIGNIGPAFGAVVQNGGVFHQRGDTVTITGDSGGVGATASVSKTSGTSAVGWTINSGGTGYRLSSNVAVFGGTGLNAMFQITEISNTEIIQLDTDTILSMQNVHINENSNTAFASLSANSSALSANLATANVNSTIGSSLRLANTTVGAISGISVLNYGYGYDGGLPTSNVADNPVYNTRIPNGSGGFKGFDASILALYAPGAIAEVSSITRGSGYIRNDNVVLVNTSRSGTENASGSPIVQGVNEYPGRYNDTKGWLSWDNVLQDNKYYQEYSYVIRSGQYLDKYKKLVEDIAHPAGTRMFADVGIDITITELQIGTYTGGSVQRKIAFGFINIDTTLPVGNTIFESTWREGRGHLKIEANTNFISAIASNTAGDLAHVRLDEFGTRRLVFGYNGTKFLEDVYPFANTVTYNLLYIADPGTPSVNAYFANAMSVRVVSSNNVLTLATSNNYYGTNTANTLYWLNNGTYRVKYVP